MSEEPEEPEESKESEESEEPEVSNNAIVDVMRHQ